MVAKGQHALSEHVLAEVSAVDCFLWRALNFIACTDSVASAALHAPARHRAERQEVKRHGCGLSVYDCMLRSNPRCVFICICRCGCVTKCVNKSAACDLIIYKEASHTISHALPTPIAQCEDKLFDGGPLLLLGGVAHQLAQTRSDTLRVHWRSAVCRRIQKCAVHLAPAACVPVPAR